MLSVLKTNIQSCDSQTDVHVVSTALSDDQEEEKICLKFNNK